MRRRETRRRGFTLIELLVILAIICVMAGAGVLSVRSGESAARVKGATRDIFAAIRQARSQALVTQKPVVVTYSTEEIDGEPVAKIEIAADELFSTPTDRSKIQGLTAGQTLQVAASDHEAEGGLIQDVLFESIREDVVRGMRLKVVKAEDEEGEVGGMRKSRVSVYSNVDYYRRKYSKAKATETSGEAGQASPGEATSGKDRTPAKGAKTVSSVERQAPVSVIWEANGRVDPHQVWVYADGQRPEDGLSIRIDQYGAAKVLPGDGEEDD